MTTLLLIANNLKKRTLEMMIRLSADTLSPILLALFVFFSVLICASSVDAYRENKPLADTKK